MNCSDKCPEDWYGLLCGQKCNCSRDQYCDPVHGCSGFINLDISIYRILAKIWVIIYELDILNLIKQWIYVYTNHFIYFFFYILACPRGTYGLNCSDKCPEDLYGLFCGQKCKCSTGQYCDPVDGCSGILNFDISIFHRIIGLIK